MVEREDYDTGTQKNVMYTAYVYMNRRVEKICVNHGTNLSHFNFSEQQSLPGLKKVNEIAVDKKNILKRFFDLLA